MQSMLVLPDSVYCVVDITMIVIIAVLIAVTGTAMAGNYSVMRINLFE